MRLSGYAGLLAGTGFFEPGQHGSIVSPDLGAELLAHQFCVVPTSLLADARHALNAPGNSGIPANALSRATVLVRTRRAMSASYGRGGLALLDALGLSDVLWRIAALEIGFGRLAPQ